MDLDNNLAVPKHCTVVHLRKLRQCHNIRWMKLVVLKLWRFGGFLRLCAYRTEHPGLLQLTVFPSG